MRPFLLCLLPSREKVDTAKRWTEEGGRTRGPLPASLRSATPPGRFAALASSPHKGRGQC